MGRHRRVALRLGDYRRVLLAALAPVAHPVALLTITPPGHARLAPGSDAYARYNTRTAGNWARMDRRAKGRLRRHGRRVTLLARVAQRQRRGLDHLHLVFRVSSPADRRALAEYVAHLKELAPEYGFGFVDDPFHRRRGKDGRSRDMVFESASIAGRYLCRYLSESDQLSAMLTAGDHSFRALWVAPELTQASGVNCRRLRRVRHAYWVVAALRQGSRPRLPLWWGDTRERVAVLRLLRLEDRAPPVALAVA